MLRSVLLAVIAILSGFGSSAQLRPGKYNSQLWEISGKGLAKPSYLFGTMHVSNKLAFHLGDSFYHAIRNVDVVALEQDPELWQSAIPRMVQQRMAYQQFSLRYTDDYLKESSFAYEGFKGNLKALLAREPAMNNSLLYRTESRTADYEENTYLDLYIYQTGRKLGKAATGVEDYMTTEQLSLEAQQDEIRAQRKQRPVNRNYNQYETLRALQDAYRKGDLDALDSLNMMSTNSEAYLEKFLYRRNEIQADAMDTIMRKRSLFVGVGAAHLPGKRGVIELLRQKGYRLRPVYMGEYDGRQKEAIDTLRVPVRFSRQWAPDSFYSVSAPGALIPLDGSETQVNYADMANGSYYLVTRMKTMPVYNGYTETRVMRIIDSLLYEAVPGKILSRKEIVRDGYKGFDLLNRTRRGDMQRYNIFITPSEILVFKMGGTENYVAGPEAETYFSSIRLRPRAPENVNPQRYGPADAGFSLDFPATPARRYTRSGPDRQPRLELEARDPATGDVYTLLRKDMYAFGFLETDTFEAALMIESLLSDDDIGKAGKRKAGTYLGYASQDVTVSAKNGDQIRARAIVQGPHEYLLAVRSKTPAKTHEAFFNSLRFTKPETGNAALIQDTFVRLSVNSPVQLRLDADIATLLSNRRSVSRMSNSDDAYDRSPEQRYGNYLHEASGDLIVVNTTVYPEYYYAKDSARFWRNELSDASVDSELHIVRKDVFRLPDGTVGYNLELSDTGSSRRIRKKLMLKGHHFFNIQTVIDGRQEESEFVRTFFASAVPFDVKAAPSVFEPKAAAFFANYYSKDTLIRKRAKSATSSMYFGTAGYPGILEAIRRLNPSAPDYYEMKGKWIAELGYLNDTAIAASVAGALDTIYRAAGDTALFQNAALQAMAQLRTSASSQLLRQLLTEDPPVFDNNSRFSSEGLLERYQDSLSIAAGLFPDLLQLAPIPDYKEPVIALLSKLIDSGRLKPELYRTQLPTLLFDARIALKKQQAEDDLVLQANHAAGDDDADSYRLREARSNMLDTSLGILYDYAVLLRPFHAENQGIQKYFERLLLSRKPELRARVGLLMLRNGMSVPESLWTGLSADSAYRSRFFTLARRAGRPGLLELPAAHRQTALVESAIRFHLSDEADTLLYIGKRPAELKGKRGQVYFYKYKKRNEVEWNLALIGIQPLEKDRFNDEPELLLSGKTLSTSKPLETVLDTELRRALISNHSGGREFYADDYSSRNDWRNIFRAGARRR